MFRYFTAETRYYLNVSSNIRSIRYFKLFCFRKSDKINRRLNYEAKEDAVKRSHIRKEKEIAGIVKKKRRFAENIYQTFDSNLLVEDVRRMEPGDSGDHVSFILDLPYQLVFALFCIYYILI